MDRRAALDAGIFAFRSMSHKVQGFPAVEPRVDPPWAEDIGFCIEALKHAIDIIEAVGGDGVQDAAMRMAFFLISGHDPVEEECQGCANWNDHECVCSQVALGFPCDPMMRSAYPRED